MNEVLPLPIFRSGAQFRILGELFTQPVGEVTIGELARRARVSQPTVSREVSRLVDAGLVRVRHEGNRSLVAADFDTAVSRDLRSMLRKLYGPAAAISDALTVVAGIEEAFIYGSWAARWHGEPGPPARDIDLMIIGNVAHDDVWDVAAALSRDFGIEVTPTIRSRSEWNEDPTGFATDVKSNHQVDVTPSTRAAV